MRGWIFVAATACGRIGFSEHRVVEAGFEDASLDAELVADAAPFCGDGVCAGNGGESCTACAADCMTTLPVCGNGTCDPGETSATCMPDCGPTPWPFGQREMDFLTAVNLKRTGGTACPGTASTTAPAFTLDPADPSPARHNAWEIAHDDSSLMSAKTCSGADMLAVFVNPAGYSVAVFGWGYVDGQSAADGFTTDPASCPIMMDPSRTIAMVGAAQDLALGWVIYMR